MHIQRNGFVLFPLTLFGFVLSSLNGHAQPAVQNLTTLKISVPSYLSSSPIFIAYEEGFFAQEGIQLEFVSRTGTSEILPTLINEEIDIISGALSPGVYNIIGRGAAIRLVAGIHTPTVDDCASFALVAHKQLLESGRLKELQDIRGLRIGGERSNIGEYLFETLIKKAGLTTADVTFSIQPAQIRHESVKRKLVDIAILSEPQLSFALEAGDIAIWHPVQDILPVSQITYLSYGPRLLTKQPELGTVFLVAYLKGVRQYNNGKTDRNLDILVKHTKLDRELLKRACWPPVQPEGRLMLDYLRQYQRWSFDKGNIDKLLPLEELVDDRFRVSAQAILKQRDGNNR